MLGTHANQLQSPFPKTETDDDNCDFPLKLARQINLIKSLAPAGLAPLVVVTTPNPSRSCFRRTNRSLNIPNPQSTKLRNCPLKVRVKTNSFSFLRCNPRIPFQTVLRAAFKRRVPTKSTGTFLRRGPCPTNTVSPINGSRWASAQRHRLPFQLALQFGINLGATPLRPRPSELGINVESPSRRAPPRKSLCAILSSFWAMGSCGTSGIVRHRAAVESQRSSCNQPSPPEQNKFVVPTDATSKPRCALPIVILVIHASTNVASGPSGRLRK